MKKTNILSITLLIAAFLAASGGLFAETIISTQDGNWNTGATWVGGNIPSSADSVVVNHVVNIINGDSCMHLNVAATGTIQNKINSTQTLVVMGNLWVDGSVVYTNNYFNIRLGGNLHLNGIWSSPRVYFIGTSEQVVSATPGKIFEATQSSILFENVDPASPLKFTTDLTFIDIELIGNGTTVEFSPGIDVAFYGEPIRDADIIGNNSSLLFRDGAFIEDSNLDNLTLKGLFNIGDDNTASGEIIVADTLQNLINKTRTLEIMGNLWVDGSVVYTNNYFNIKLSGNLHLNGIWSSPRVYFIGTSEQVVSATPGKIFEATRSSILFENVDPASPLKFTTDLTFIDIELIGNGSTIEFSPGIEVAFYGEPIRDVDIIGNNSSLLFRDGAFIEDSNLDNLTLKGVFNVGDDNTASGEIIVADTLQNLISSSRTLNMNGNFTNNGLIRITNNYFHFDFAGDVTNNGEWTCANIKFDGAGNQYIAGSSGKYIFCNEFNYLDSTNKIILTSDFDIRNAAININKGEMIANGNTLSLRDGARFLNGILENARLGGVFQVDNPQPTFRGTTYVDDTLQNYTEYSDQSVLVDGDLVVGGVIRKSNYYGINLSITGDIENNSYIETNQLRFTGPADQIISSTAKGNEFEVDDIFDDDSASAIIVNSDILFTNSLIDLQGASIVLNNGNLSMSGGNLENGTVEGYDHYIHQNNNSWFLGMNLSNLELKGVCQVRGPNNYFDNVTLTDTLQNYSAYTTTYLYTTGNFINNGVITFTNDYKIFFKVEGNFFNYGNAELKTLEFTGAGDNEFSSHVLPITNTPFVSSKTGGSVIAVDDVLLEGCNVNLNWDVLDLQGTDITMTGGKLMELNIEGNGNKLIVDGNGVAENVGFNKLFIEGKLYMRGQNNTFDYVTLTDTLSRQSNYYSVSQITTTGSFINNGYIMAEGSWDMYFYVNDTVINNGHWFSDKLIFTGADMHYIESQNANPFEVEDISNPAKGGEVEILSDLYLLNATIDFDDVGLYIPAAGILNLDNSTINQVTVTCGDFASINCMNNSLISNSTIDGAIISGAVDIATNTFIDCVIDGLVQNDEAYSHYTLYFEGDLTNNGSIINNPSWTWDLQNSVLGNVYNNGTWETEKSNWQGLLDQDIYLMNDSEINTLSEFYSMLGTSSYQWYKNDEAIDGETSSYMDFPAITTAERGYYHCTTNEGTSRTIRICTPIDIDLVDEAYFCQYESVMIEATPTSGDGPYTYLWEPAEGLSDPTIANPLANPATPTEYTVTITDAIGCKGQASIFVQQYPQLYADAGADKEICFGGNTYLYGNASGGDPDYTFSWSPSTGLNNSNIAQPIASPNETTLYTLTVSDFNGCTESANVNVTVNPLPLAFGLSQDSTHFCYEQDTIICWLLSSEIGVNYELLVNDQPNPGGEVFEGTGGPIPIWASTTVQGHYTLKGKNQITGCQKMMIGSVMIFIDFLPEIVDQSGDEILIEGTDITLWVDVTSTQPPWLKWYKNDMEIPGATNHQYLLENVSLSDTGTYYCVVTNNCASTQSEPVNIIVLSQQAANVPAGWSGISTYLNIWDDDVDKIFQDVQNDLILVNDFEHMYWPGQNINSYADGKWDTYTGAQIKLSAPATVDFQGLQLDDLTVDLYEAWTYLPVLHQSPVPAHDLFMQAPNQIIIAKDIAGTGVYWPEYGINTLDILNPNMAYLVKVSEATELDFGLITKSGAIGTKTFRPQNVTPWNNPVYSNISHTIALPKEVAILALMPGDWIGVFNAEDVCCGIVQYSGNSIAIPVFGNDNTTYETDGLLENEWMSFKAYRPSSGEMYDLVVGYDASVNDPGYFTANGMSVISGLKAEATGLGANSQSQIRVYPNPTNGIVFIEGISIDSQIEITNAAGQVVYKTDALGKESIDLGNQARGLYSIRITNQKFTSIHKMMVE